MQKWEYVTHAVPVAPLTDLGQDGWRLVTVDDGIMFFERPFVEPPPQPVADQEPAAVEPAVVEPPSVVPPEPQPASTLA